MRLPRTTANDSGYVALVFLAALLLRLVSLPAAAAGGLRLLSPDCYGHLRRSVSVARNFPRVPVVDPYLNHPDGGVWIWPPLFDLAVGGGARLLFGRGASLENVAWTGAALPPLLGSLHVFPLFLLARRVLGRRRARLAVAAYAVLPSAVLWSCFGHADHHVAEGLVLLVFLAAAAGALRPGSRARGALAAAIALAAALLTWQGAVFIAGLAFPWAALALGPAAALLGAGAALLTAAGTALTLGGRTVPFSFVSFSWFQPLLLAAGTLPLALLAAFRARTSRERALAAAASVVLLAIVAPNARALAGALARGSAHLVTESRLSGADDVADGGYLSYPKDLLSLIAECQPLLAGHPVPALADALGGLSAGLAALPFALVLWLAAAHRHRRRPVRRDALLLLALFGGALLAMTLFQRRNVYYLGIFTALALAEVLARVTIRSRALRGLGGVLLAAALVVVPGLPSLARVRVYAGAPGHDFLDLFARLGALDPPGVDPAALPPPSPGALAGVMAPWAAGHFATALTARPAGADPFAYGWRRQCRLYTTTDDGEAWRILREARCKYLVTTDTRPVLAAYAAAAGRPGTPFDSMFLVRVHESDAAAPAPFLSLVLVSRTGARAPGGRVIPRFKVFRVAGVEDSAPVAP